MDFLTDYPLFVTLVVAAAVASLLFLSLRHARASARLPPGPPSGYLGQGRFDMPKEPYKRFSELANTYGWCCVLCQVVHASSVKCRQVRCSRLNLVIPLL